MRQKGESWTKGILSVCSLCSIIPEALSFGILSELSFCDHGRRVTSGYSFLKDSCLCARRERTQTNQRGADRRVMIACSQGRRPWPRPIRRNLTSLSIESQSDSPRYSIEPTRNSRWGSYSPSYVMIHPFHLSNEVWLEFHARSIPSQGISESIPLNEVTSESSSSHPILTAHHLR